MAAPGKARRERYPVALALCHRAKTLVSNDLHRTVVITVIAMGMMQMAVDEIVEMIAVRHRLVAATEAMNVSSVMSGTAMVWRASIRTVPGCCGL
jgi:hypothetical protein